MVDEKASNKNEGKDRILILNLFHQITIIGNVIKMQKTE